MSRSERTFAWCFRWMASIIHVLSLRELDPPSATELLPRRGAPWTFDAEGCCAAFAAAKAQGEAVLPTYSRELSDPVPDGVRLECRHKIILAEGNYLLMQHDARWAPLDELWDERWFIRCTDPAAQRRRLIYRHLETWNEEEDAAMGGQARRAPRRAPTPTTSSTWTSSHRARPLPIV